MGGAFLHGMAVGGGLIVAIGAQNAFVLTQGVRRNHHLEVAVVCILCDAALISAGVSGIGSTVAASPRLALAATALGACFLFWYGLRALLSAWKGNVLGPVGASREGLLRTMLQTLAVTLLNPHVYLDTVVLMGSISAHWPEGERPLFGLGAITASTVWFSCLSLGGRLLAPLFRRTLTWRILDGLVCMTMWSIALSLLFRM